MVCHLTPFLQGKGQLRHGWLLTILPCLWKTMWDPPRSPGGPGRNRQHWHFPPRGYSPLGNSQYWLAVPSSARNGSNEEQVTGLSSPPKGSNRPPSLSRGGSMDCLPGKQGWGINHLIILRKGCSQGFLPRGAPWRAVSHVCSTHRYGQPVLTAPSPHRDGGWRQQGAPGHPRFNPLKVRVHHCLQGVAAATCISPSDVSGRGLGYSNQSSPLPASLRMF